MCFVLPPAAEVTYCITSVIYLGQRSWKSDRECSETNLYMFFFFFVSRLQHHESAGGQRESARKQRPALSRRRRRQPRWRPRPGHASSDGCIAQPQVSPLPAHAHTPPPAAHTLAPPAGCGHRAQCGRRVLISGADIHPPAREDTFFNQRLFLKKKTKHLCWIREHTIGTVSMDVGRQKPQLDSKPTASRLGPPPWTDV